MTCENGFGLALQKSNSKENQVYVHTTLSHSLCTLTDGCVYTCVAVGAVYKHIYSSATRPITN